MEFYSSFLSNLGFPLGFQFPTGWNSTLGIITCPIVIFRFNSQRDGILPGAAAFEMSAEDRFNSQRDGILRKQIQTCKNRLEFQFPTGWNSTVSTPRPLSAPRSFNSQRDGILLYILPSVEARVKFQFPTGWNSTDTGAAIYKLSNAFQFPTGWNSTKHKRFSTIPAFCFNSQRDGILHNPYAVSNSDRKFQFPTGWNSTV